MRNLKKISTIAHLRFVKNQMGIKERKKSNYRQVPGAIALRSKGEKDKSLFREHY
jgi:hypothetical protein